MKKKLSVIIVNYNSYEDCITCVKSILSKKIVEEDSIVIVDNKSPDGSGIKIKEAFPDLKIIFSEKNGGFGYGINLGLNTIDTPYYLILNPDTKFEENKIDEAISLIESSKKIGLVGLNLVNSDGSLQYSARRFYSILTVFLRRTPLGSFGFFKKNIQEHLLVHKWIGEPFECDWVIGAGFIVKQEAFKHVGGMDERFFLYLEDTDLCMRLWKNGWTVITIPSVKLIHDHQRASSNRLFSFASKQHFKSLILFIRKHGLPLWGHGKARNSRRLDL